MALSGILAPQPAATFSSEKEGSQQLQYTNNANINSLSSSPRQFPTDLSHPILEEGDESEESPNEPVTPVSGRQSQEFTTLPNQETNHDLHLTDTSSQHPSSNPQTTTAVAATTPKPPLIVNTAASPSPPPADSAVTPKPAATPIVADQDLPPTPLSRRQTASSTRSFKRTMSTFFRRANSQSGTKDFAFTESDRNAASETNLNDSGPPKIGSRRFSMNKSHTTTRSNSPPSPGSPLEMKVTNKEQPAATATVPSSDDFKKKNRASTGLTFRGRAVNFVSGNANAKDKAGAKRVPPRKRASSFDGKSNQHFAPNEEAHEGGNPAIPINGPSPWAQLPEHGVGVKARRMSLSLPDDFTVDVADLLTEYEYQSKLLGRHGKHLGKGATSKVTLMARKGYPDELYAVKEFRGKTRKEGQDDYEKKVKSEFSIAKSLHHPNIVETIALCTNAGRWNHVMEYCSEGDLFGLVQKGYLKDEARLGDRLCLFKQLIQGINYLHCNGIAHRDIKLENLLITKDSKLKITDFGVSEVFSGTHPGLREAGGQCGRNMYDTRLCQPGMCGSEPYVAPEVLNKTEMYDPRALDVWSSAIIMIYLTFGGAIWMKAVPGQVQFDLLIKGWEKWNARHPEPDACVTENSYPAFQAFDEYVKPPALRRILLRMLNPDPSKRASIADIINNRWTKNIECCQLESYDDPVQTIDASKKDYSRAGAKKIFCHNHLPIQSHGHSLGKMPGAAGY